MTPTPNSDSLNKTTENKVNEVKEKSLEKTASAAVVCLRF